MKKWLFLLLILAIGATVTAQNYTDPNPGTYGLQYNRLMAKITMLIPTFCGTPTLNSSVTNRAGIAYDSCNNKFYLWNPKVGGGWSDVGSAPDSTIYATVWRLVNDSTILRNLINGKVNIADTIAMLSGYQRSGNPVTVAGQPNITSLGTLTGLTVSGLITAGTISSTITQPIQPNITQVGSLSNLTVTGSINAANITVSGTVTSGVISSTTGHINNLTVPGTITGGTFSGTLSPGTQAGITQLGTLSTLTVTGTITGGTFSGILSSSTQAGITQLGVLNSLTVTNSITAGSVSATTITGTLATANQPNITNVGTLGSLNVTGTITAGTLSGALSAGAQNSITNLANLTAITVTGNITAGTISGTLTSTVPWSKITSTPTTIAGYGITDAVATTSTYYIGTTLITFNRASASQSLTGVSIDGNAGSATLWGTQAFASGSPVTPLYAMVFDNSTSQWRPATNTVLQTWLGYLTGNQTITLSGDVSGSGTTAITTTIGAAKVTNAMLAGSIAASKLVGTDITTIGTLSAGAVPYSLLTGTVPTWNQNTTGSAGSVANALTINNGGAGDASGSTFNGSAAKTISYNSVGASPLAGSTSLVTTGTVTTGVWNAGAITTSGPMVIRGTNPGGVGANTAVIDALSGSTRWFSYGPNTSTNGTFELSSQRSNGSNPLSVLTIDGSGNGVFLGTVTATNFIGPGTGLTGTATTLNIGGNAATATSSTNSTLWNSLTYDGTNAAINTFVMAYHGGTSYGPSNAATLKTFAGYYTSGDNVSFGTIDGTGDITTTKTGSDAIVWAKNGTVSTYMVANTTGTLEGIVGTATNHPFVIRTNNTDRYTISASGNNVWTGSGQFGGNINSTVTTGNFFTATSATTSAIYMQLVNTSGGSLFGVNGSSAAGIFTGGAAYATSIGSTTNTAFQVGTNNTVRYTIDGSGNNTWTGSGTFGGLITSTRGNNTQIWTAASATTGYQYFDIINTGGRAFVGLEGNTGGTLITGSLAYASLWGSVTATAAQLIAAGNVGATLLSDGKFGIGTNAPGVMLEVKNPGSVDGRVRVKNSSNGYIDIISSSTDGYISTEGNGALHLRTSSSTNNGLDIATNGAGTFASSVTATSFFESSDIRYKNVVSRTKTAAGYDMIQFYWKKELNRDEVLHYGYEAQQVQSYLPNMVKADENGFLSVNYIEVLVRTVTQLEARIVELEKNKK